MNQTLLSRFLDDIQAGRAFDEVLLWQIFALVACLVVSWAVARVVRDRLLAHNSGLRIFRAGVEAFARIGWPLLALVLIAIVRPVLGQWQEVSLLSLAIPLVGSFALIRMVFHILRRAFARGGRAGAFLLVSETVIATLVWGGVALYITGLWPEVRAFLASVPVPLGRSPTSLLVVLQALVSVFITLLVALWVGTLLEDRLMRMDSVHTSLRAVLARLGRGVLILVAVLASLSIVGIDLTVLSVFGGALGVGLGLGLQRLASSYVSGFVILLERSLTLGDVVTVDKFSGMVTRINTRYTVVRSMDGTETVIPNDMLVSAPMQNSSLSDRNVRLATKLVVSYQTDIDACLQLLCDTAASFPRVLKDPAPRALLTRFEADGFEVELGFWIGDPENGRGALLSDVNRAIWRAFQERGIEIPYPQRELRILNNPWMHGPSGETHAAAAKTT